MDRNETFIKAIRDQGILPLFYHDDREVCLAVTRALYDAGVRVIEFTHRGQSAAANFDAMVAERNSSMKDLVLAVGTIRNPAQAIHYIQAGADFLISPVFDPEVADEAYLAKTLWIPGCMTPTEIHEAEKAGCGLVKLFPGNVLGPAFVAGVRELFPGMDFMPTGGVEVTRESIGAWMKAGVCAVGLGSKLISKTILDNRDYKAITSVTREALEIVASLK